MPAGPEEGLEKSATLLIALGEDHAAEVLKLLGPREGYYKVSFVGQKSGYGNVVEISHGNGMVTRYAHMSKFRSRVGQEVAAGDVIGAIGSTGRSTGPHLHFEVRINDRAVNPRPFLEAAPNVLKEARRVQPEQSTRG